MRHNYGGICMFFRRNLKVRLVDFPLYKSFELLPLFIFNPPITTLLLVVYRPGSKPPTVDFIEEFGDLLERSSSYNQCIIVGDVNLHLDDPKAPQVGSFLLLLDNFDLTERVREPTHKLGHQLDVFITRSNQPVPAMTVYPPLLLSDHSLITASFTGPDKQSVPRRPRIKCRCWKRLDIECFAADLNKSDLVANPPIDATELFHCYNTTLKQLVMSQSLLLRHTRDPTHRGLIVNVHRRKLKQDDSRKYLGISTTVRQNGSGSNSFNCKDYFIHQSSQHSGRIE